MVIPAIVLFIPAIVLFIPATPGVWLIRRDEQRQSAGTMILILTSHFENDKSILGCLLESANTKQTTHMHILYSIALWSAACANNQEHKAVGEAAHVRVCEGVNG